MNEATADGDVREHAYEYDVVVVGGGPVGENVAERVRSAGLTAVIVERELLGGECSYWACEPSKALLRPVLARADALRVPGLRRAAEGPLDVDAVLAHRDAMAFHWKDDAQADWLDSVSVDLVRGHGRLDGPRRVTVTTPEGDTVRLAARHAVVLGTGSVPSLPPVPGLDRVRPWTSREATGARRVPGSLAVVGGGVVAVEMATAWQALGSKVTLLVIEDHLLGRMEPFVGEMAEDGLREAGVDIRYGTAVESLRRHDAAGGRAPVRITLSTGEELTADEILFATGRTPRTRDVGLDRGAGPGRPARRGRHLPGHRRTGRLALRRR